MEARNKYQEWVLSGEPNLYQCISRPIAMTELSAHLCTLVLRSCGHQLTVQRPATIGQLAFFVKRTSRGRWHEFLKFVAYAYLCPHCFADSGPTCCVHHIKTIAPYEDGYYSAFIVGVSPFSDIINV